MTVLLEMLSGKKKLFHGLDFVRTEGGFRRVWNRTYVGRFGVPSEKLAPGVVGDDDVESVERRVAHGDYLVINLFGRESQRLLGYDCAAIGHKFDRDCLFGGGEHLEIDFGVAGGIDVEKYIL